MDGLTFSIKGEVDFNTVYPQGWLLDRAKLAGENHHQLTLGAVWPAPLLNRDWEFE